jgi:hypothetical protein
MRTGPRPFRITLPHALRLVMRDWDLIEIPRQGCYLISPTGHTFSILSFRDMLVAEPIFSQDVLR